MTDSKRLVVLLDADTVAGWRRQSPSLEQLHRARADLVRQHPDVQVAVVADASIKWALPDSEQDAFERDIVSRDIVCAPAGTVDGPDGWVCAVVEQVRANGNDVVIVTDRAVGGVPVARLRFDAGRFSFDLAGAKEVEARATPQWRRRRRKG
ncbi:MAG: hypothetical protein GY812_08585 [Actinomycetia bacterium]|nr:hypothetical protein [Actinomycetes bacterium]